MSNPTIVKIEGATPIAGSALYFEDDSDGWLPILDTTTEIETSFVAIHLGNKQTGAYEKTHRTKYSHTVDLLVTKSFAEGETSNEYKEYGWPENTTRTTPGKSTLSELAHTEKTTFSQWKNTDTPTAMETWIRLQAIGDLKQYSPLSNEGITSLSTAELVGHWSECTCPEEQFTTEIEEYKSLINQAAQKALLFGVDANIVTRDIREAIEATRS